MALPTATMRSENPDAVARAARTLERSKNGPMVMQGDMNARREPQFYIYIYNVGPTTQDIPRPWAIGGRIHVPSCPLGQDYIEAYKIPDIVQENAGITGSNEIVIRGRDGRFYAQDALNPDEPQGDWRSKTVINKGLSTSMGTNLYNYGLFWTTSNPPEPEAVDAARKRWLKTSNELIEQGTTYWVAQQDTKYSGDKVGNLHHLAADWLQIETDWHRRFEPKKACPGCGEQLSMSAVICKSCSATFDWAKAVSLGLRTKQQALDSGIKL